MGHGVERVEAARIYLIFGPRSAKRGSSSNWHRQVGRPGHSRQQPKAPAEGSRGGPGWRSPVLEPHDLRHACPPGDPPGVPPGVPTQPRVAAAAGTPYISILITQPRGPSAFRLPAWATVRAARTLRGTATARRPPRQGQERPLSSPLSLPAAQIGAALLDVIGALYDSAGVASLDWPLQCTPGNIVIPSHYPR